MNPFADHRDLYLLVAGVLIGLMLSPAILGRVAPDLYQQLFIGGTLADQQEALDYHAAVRDEIQTLIAQDRPSTDIEQHLNALRLEGLNPVARLEQLQRERSIELMGVLGAIMIVVVVVMVLETLAAPQESQGGRAVVRPVVGRLKSARYALMALWLALFLANPVLLWHLPWLFAALILVVALVLCMIPLGQSRSQAQPAEGPPPAG